MSQPKPKKSENSGIVSTMLPEISESNADQLANQNREPKWMREDAGIAPTSGNQGPGGARMVIDKPAPNVQKPWRFKAPANPLNEQKNPSGYWSKEQLTEGGWPTNESSRTGKQKR